MGVLFIFAIYLGRYLADAGPKEDSADAGATLMRASSQNAAVFQGSLIPRGQRGVPR